MLCGNKNHVCILIYVIRSNFSAKAVAISYMPILRIEIDLIVVPFKFSQ